MRVKTIIYAMLRQIKQYENDRIEVVIELGEGESVPLAIKTAKALCEAALQAKPVSKEDAVSVVNPPNDSKKRFQQIEVEEDIPF